MKNYTLYGIIALIFVGIVIAGVPKIIEKIDPLSTLNNIGDKVELETEIEEGDLKLKIKQDVEIIGYENVYKTVIVYDQNNLSQQYHNLTILDENKQGNPILKYHEPTEIEYESGLKVDINKNSCWTCSDTWVICLDNKDGGTSVGNRQEKFKCDQSGYPIKLSGELGDIYNINTGEIQ